MIKENIKTINIYNENSDQRYNYRFRGDDIDSWANNLFYIFINTRWPNYQDNLTVEIDEKNDKLSIIEEKEKTIEWNKGQYLKLVNEFLQNITNKNDAYELAFTTYDNSKITGSYNNTSFSSKIGDKLIVKTPSLKKLDIKFKYLFEKNFVNKNFFLEKTREYYENESIYEKDENFVNDLENIINQHFKKFDYINDEQNIIGFEIEPLKDTINNLNTTDNVKEALLQSLNQPNLNFEDYGKISSIARYVSHFNKDFSSEDNLIIREWNGRENIKIFFNFLANNPKVNKLLDKSVDKRDIIKLYANYYTDDKEIYIKQIQEKEDIIFDFWNKHEKEIVETCLDNYFKEKDLKQNKSQRKI